MVNHMEAALLSSRHGVVEEHWLIFHTDGFEVQSNFRKGLPYEWELISILNIK